MRDKGFTLVEMLILLALTSLLISMLVPALSAGRERAVGLECQSNLRQIGTIHTMRDRWGSSAYDLGDSGLSRPSGFNDNGKQPIRVNPNGVIGAKEFHADMEEIAQDVPRDWFLLCPVADREHRNSYGIRFQMIGLPTYTGPLIRQRDVIFGCSDFKVVDVASNFAARHVNNASYMFADIHVEQRPASEVFSDEELSEKSKRQTPPPHNNL